MTARRVALDATPLLGRRTGIGVFCTGLLEALAGRDDLALSAYAVSWRRREGIAGLLPSGVTRVTRAMPARPLHFAWRHGDVPPAEWFVGPVDVVHGTNYVVPPTRRAATVVSVYDLTTVRYPELCDPATLAFPDLVRRAVARGAWVHTLSHFVADEVVDVLGVAPERVRAVWSGVPALEGAGGAGVGGAAGAGAAGAAGVEPPAGTGTAGAAGVSDGGYPAGAVSGGGAPADFLPDGCRRYVLAVGTVEPRKDLPGLVRAFADLAADHRDVALVLAGAPGWGVDQLDQEVAALPDAGLRARVVRTGWVADRQLAGLLRGAEVLAYPSRYEGFGFPPLQAMAVGVPVVATTAGSLPEMLDGAAELVAPGDEDALAGALGRVLGSPDRRAELAEAGRARAAGFSWERCASGVAELYAAAVAA